MLFNLFTKKSLGIDIGTAAIRLVELSSRGQRIKLENYGQVLAPGPTAPSLENLDKTTLLFSGEDTAKAIRAVLNEARIKTRRAFFSIPDFSTFFTTFELPIMNPSELSEAIKGEARRHVPIPIREITLDWELIEDKINKVVKVTLAAIPNEVVNQYQRIATAADLELVALEAEAFALVRSLVGKQEKRTIGSIEIGLRSTTWSIIDEGNLKVSHSFDIGGNVFTESLAHGFSIDYETAEEFKKRYGILPLPEYGRAGEKLKELLVPLLNSIIREGEKIFKSFYFKEKKNVEKIILAGESVFLPGLLQYFQDYFKIEIEVANPFSKISYPPILDETLKKMGPSYAIAIGMALRSFE